MKIKSFETLLIACFFFGFITLTQAIKDAVVIKSHSLSHKTVMVIANNR